jgi:D-alanine-D-alanine ligase
MAPCLRRVQPHGLAAFRAPHLAGKHPHIDFIETGRGLYYCSRMQPQDLLVGLVYDLRDDYLAEGFSAEETAEFDKPDTIEGIENSLRELGYRTARIGNAKALVQALAAGRRWDMVFNIAEGMFGAGREALVPALLDAYQIPYTFSDPAVLTIALDKALTKGIVRDAGVPTAPFATLHDASDIARLRLPYPLFLKPLTEGTGKGISSRSRVQDAAELRAVATDLLARFRQPVLVETFLPGREFTVGLAGRGDAAGVLGVIEVNFKPGSGSIYSYQTKSDYEKLVTYTVPDDAVAREAAEVALAAWRALRCVDAGRADVRCDADGRPNFIEVNPLAGLNPTHSDLPILCRKNGISFTQLIGRIMSEALARQPLRDARSAGKTPA